MIAAAGAGMPVDRVAVLGDMATLLEVAAFPLAAILIAWAAAGSLPKPGPLRWRDPLIVCGALFVAMAAVSALASPFRHAAFTALAIVLAAMLCGAATSAQAADRRSALILCAVLWAAGLVVAGIGVNEYVRTWWSGRSDWRVFGPFADPNFLAGYLILTIPLSAAMFLTSARGSMAALGVLGLVLQVVCVLLTQSRLGVLALAAGGACGACLLWWSGVCTGAVRRRMVALLACVVVAGAIGARPVLRRLTLARGEAYSARFRLMTWQGAQRMALANPVRGAGLGSFEHAYPRYASVGFTAHAHNSYVQMAGEAGLPATLALLGLIAGTLAAATTGLRRMRSTAKPAFDPDASDLQTGAGGARGVLDASALEFQGVLREADPRLLLAGLAGGCAGSIVHNIFDSDLYVPSIAITFAAMSGLIHAISRHDADPADAPKPGRSIRMVARVGAAALAVLVSPMLYGRVLSLQAAPARAAGDARAAAAAYRDALAVDPLNPDYLLSLASIEERTNQPKEALRAYATAIDAAPSAKALRRRGKLRMRTGDAAGALRDLEAARRADPHDLQALLALAELHAAAGRSADATAIYRTIADQYRSPVGQIRAVPEIIDWEYGRAYLELGIDRAAARDDRSAEPDLREAVAVLGECWRTRNDSMSRARGGSAEALAEAVTQYDRALEAWASALERLGRTADAAAARARQQTFRSERDAEARPSGGS